MTKNTEIRISRDLCGNYTVQATDNNGEWVPVDSEATGLTREQAEDQIQGWLENSDHMTRVADADM